jgi:hypothetical protein
VSTKTPKENRSQLANTSAGRKLAEEHKRLQNTNEVVDENMQRFEEMRLSDLQVYIASAIVFGCRSLPPAIRPTTRPPTDPALTDEFVARRTLWKLTSSRKWRTIAKRWSC